MDQKIKIYSNKLLMGEKVGHKLFSHKIVHNTLQQALMHNAFDEHTIIFNKSFILEFRKS